MFLFALATAYVVPGVVFAALSVDEIAVAFIAAVASVANTLILVRARATQTAIHTEVRSLRLPVQELRDLSDKRDYQIDELRGVNSALTVRARELTQLARDMGRLGESDRHDQ